MRASYPLRGYKGDIYEGGTKVPAFLHYGGLPLLRGRYSEMFHAVDILPTLMEIVSKESLPEGLDGVSHWSAMQTDMSSTRPNTRRMVASPRDLMVYNIDDELITEIFNVQNRTRKFQIGVRYKSYKLLLGISTMLHRFHRKKHESTPIRLELYNLTEDPGEKINIAASHQSLVEFLQDFALKQYLSIIPPKAGQRALHTKNGFGSTDWCRPVKYTSCVPLENADSNTYLDSSSTVFYGTFQNFQCKNII